MNAYERMHPPGGYGLGRHGAAPQPPVQSAQQLAAGSPGADAAPPAATAPQGPQQRAQQLLSQRRAAPAPGARPAPAPSLAAPPAAPAPASPLAAPPVAPAPSASPLASPAPVAPAPEAAPAQSMGDFLASGRSMGDWMAQQEANPRGGGDSWANDPRSNPNNVMGNFIDPATKRGYSDFLNPALQVSPGGVAVAPGTPGFQNPNVDPQAIYAKPPPLVDTLPPPDKLPGFVNPANRGR